ncbi:amino acid ABC transporter permease [Aeromonas taiwanensis]|uniref:amino acid ABC transporter permease n=1 Tax=Aeromonas taiwanensis TaxID=633417 RepID=UPI00207C2CD0|nr:amino acid ABC transporter permease [Aeromonas taiwanensis]MCO4203698.1 amino acid ABC transporter permease [Aeromonas taiwanensis]
MDWSAWKLLFEGALTTLWISGTAIVLGVTAGLLIALLRRARIPLLDPLLACYISLARATPLVTLVLFLFLSLPALGIQLNKQVAAILALTLNTAAFNAEIWRSALNNFSRNQHEAALAVGMTDAVFFRRIMLPQLVTVSLPALVNEMSSLIKSSPAIAVIGLVDLTRVTNRIASVTYEPLPPILGAGLIYVLMIALLVKAQHIAERRAHHLAM